MTDEPKDDAERAEAEALARALAQGQLPPSAVDDAVEAADVVRMLNAPMLSEERLEAALAETERRIAARRHSQRRLIAIGAAGSVLAIAAAALLIVRAPLREPAQHSVAPVVAAAPAAAPREPGPALARERLIEAQLAMLEAPSAEARGTLERALRDYRDERLSMFEQEYTR